MVEDDTIHPDLAALQGTKVAGRYEVGEVLGVGGMGVVFKGHHLGLKRDVAIKVLHPELTRDQEISKRFEREAHSASRLDHPNCTQVTDVGTTDSGLMFMVMQLLEGSELADSMGEVYAPDRAVLLTLQILSGLEHAHENGVIHRDIKPENIFLTRDHAGRELVKIVDFGIAKLVGASDGERNMTKAGLVFGTPAYMSPEQAMGQQADARADLYSVGILLWEMLVGAQPFTADDPVALVRMQVSKDPPPLPESVPAMLQPIVSRLLAKQREERYDSATQARLALEEVLPSIVTTDITGMTLYPGASQQIALSNSGTIGLSGHPVSQPSGAHPIVVAGSGPISVGVSNPITSEHARMSTMPPLASTLEAKPDSRKWAIVGGAVAAVVVVAALAMSGGDDAPAEAAAVAAQPKEAAVAVQEDGGEDEILIVDEDEDPTDSQLAEIDRLILAKKTADADKLLGPLLDRFPDDARLIWRYGRMLTDQGRKKRSQALAAYGKALEKSPALLEDRDFYAELVSLMRRKEVRDEALNLALRQMGATAHTFLLELVNDERKPLSYDDRHRALEELQTVPSDAELINVRLNRALDVLQAHQSLTPCGDYHAALNAIEATPDYYYYARVDRGTLPEAKSGKHLAAAEQEDAARCANVVERREEVLGLLAALEPSPADDGGSDGGSAGEPAGSGATPASGGGKSGGSKSGSGKSGGSKSAKKPAGKPANCKKFGAGVFNPKCR